MKHLRLKPGGITVQYTEKGKQTWNNSLHPLKSDRGLPYDKDIIDPGPYQPILIPFCEGCPFESQKAIEERGGHVTCGAWGDMWVEGQ